MAIRNMGYKNTWGSPQSGIDQQRADLFYIVCNYPAAIIGESPTVWDQYISWTIEKFPFPEREVESVPIKHGQQTNYQIGGDKALDAITITFRYAFNQRTLELLEKWSWLISNPYTGGVGIASHVKTNGVFYWLVPSMDKQATLSNTSESGTFIAGGAYNLEGVWLKSMKISDADVTDGNKFVTAECKFQIDRYYPTDPSKLTITGNATSVGSINNVGVATDSSLTVGAY